MTLQEREELTHRLLDLRAMFFPGVPHSEVFTGIIDAIIQIIGPIPARDQPEPWDDPEEREAIQDEPSTTSTYYLLRNPRL